MMSMTQSGISRIFIIVEAPYPERILNFISTNKNLNREVNKLGTSPVATRKISRVSSPQKLFESKNAVGDLPTTNYRKFLSRRN